MKKLVIALILLTPSSFSPAYYSLPTEAQMNKAKDCIMKKVRVFKKEKLEGLQYKWDGEKIIRRENFNL